MTSRDGRRWSAPQTVGTSADEVYPAIAVDRGRVAVTFYTRTYDAAGTGLDYAAVTSSAGPSLGALGSSRVRRITTQTSDPAIQFVGIGAVTGTILQGVFIGDYTSVAMGTDGVFHPAWTDFRGAPGTTSPNQDAYTQAVRFDR